ncbi:hypothetical protein KAR91_10185 [Candidatus Pacearchaeota archaeon]|nr:hypothetical protein [Candidatus Pacearchaeota archaeon]
MLGTLWRELHRLDETIEKEKPGTDEYDRLLKEIKEITIIENSILERAEFKDWNVSRLDKFLKNAPLVGAVGTFGVAFLTLNYERLEVVTSRAFGFVKPRL